MRMHFSVIGLTFPGRTTQNEETNNNKRYQNKIEHTTHDAHRHTTTHVVGMLATAMHNEHKVCWDIVWLLHHGAIRCGTLPSIRNKEALKRRRCQVSPSNHRIVETPVNVPALVPSNTDVLDLRMQRPTRYSQMNLVIRWPQTETLFKRRYRSLRRVLPKTSAACAFGLLAQWLSHRHDNCMPM